MKNVAVLTEDGAFALFFRPRRRGFDSSRVPTIPGNFPSKAKKCQMPGCQCLGVSPDVGCVCVGRGGSGWAQLGLTDTKTSQMYSITVLCKTISFCPLVILCFSEGFSPTKWISSNSLEIEVGSSNNDIASLLSSLFLIVD